MSQCKAKTRLPGRSAIFYCIRETDHLGEHRFDFGESGEAEAPAAPAEPVAWASWMNGPCEVTKDKHRADSWAANGGDVRPLFLNPAAPAPLRDGFRDIDEVVAELESQPGGRERMDRAREEVAAMLTAAPAPDAATVDQIMALADEYERLSGFVPDSKQKEARAALRAAVERVVQERDFAIAHDRQPYPTADAYEKVCAARTTWQERAERAEAERDALRAEIERRDTAQVPDSGDA